MDKRFGMAGWKQFLQNRRDILCEVDKLLEQTYDRPIKTAHGEAGEAKVREWLSHFLPKKYAVTSGYIIPDVYEEQVTQYHFDVIIYDTLEAPVLWIEGNDDHSPQGKSKAIPAKYVKAVYEVKASLTLKSAREAVAKLKQLNSFDGKLDTSFSCGMLFIDLHENDINRQSILTALHEGHMVKNCWGGAILRCKADDSATAEFEYFPIDPEKPHENDKSPLMKPIDDIDIYMLEDGNVQMASSGGARFMSDGINKWYVTKLYFKRYYDSSICLSLNWSRSGFSDFAMSILSFLDGVPRNEYENKAVYGKVFDSLDKKEATKQNIEKVAGLPFLELSLEKDKETDNYLNVKKVNDSEFECTLHFSVTNTGFKDTEMSSDQFKTTTHLEVGKSAKNSISVGVFKDEEVDSQEFDDEITRLNNGEAPLKLTRKVLYKVQSENNQNDFYALNVQLEVYRDTYHLEII